MTAILIAGATGLVGGEALRLSLADARVDRVIAPTRRPLPSHDKLLNPVTGLDPLPADADAWAADGIVCALGTTRAKAGSAGAFRAVDLDLVLAVARFGRLGGARSFALTSSTGANPCSRLLYSRTKGEAEQAVIELGYESLTILRPGLLGGDREEYRLGERIAAGLLRLLGPILPRKARISPAATVARVLVEAAIAGPPGVHIVESGGLSG